MKLGLCFTLGLVINGCFVALVLAHFVIVAALPNCLSHPTCFTYPRVMFIPSYTSMHHMPRLHLWCAYSVVLSPYTRLVQEQDDVYWYPCGMLAYHALDFGIVPDLNHYLPGGYVLMLTF